MSRRLALFLGTSLGLSWGAWGALLPLARRGEVAYGEWRFMLLYMLGGLGPTIGAYVAVTGTRKQSPLAEFHGRLLRWRLSGWWYVVAVGIPVSLAAAATAVEAQIAPGLGSGRGFRPWYMFFPLFVVMVLGGGLEELGWRGVAQPEVEGALGRSSAAIIVGLVWAIWHIPLFAVPGVSQFHTFFPTFAVNIMGAALILGWLQGRTGSILLCVMFHAASNAIAALGFTVPEGHGWLGLVNGGLSVGLGCILLGRNPGGPTSG